MELVKHYKWMDIFQKQQNFSTSFKNWNQNLYDSNLFWTFSVIFLYDSNLFWTFSVIFDLY